MLGLDTVERIAHVIQIALTPVFLLSDYISSWPVQNLAIRR